MLVNAANQQRLAVEAQLAVEYLHLSKADVAGLSFNRVTGLVHQGYGQAIEIGTLSAPQIRR